MENAVSSLHGVVLYDGVCNLCDASVRFIIKHDRQDRFRFAPLQSEAGIRIADQHDITPDYSTFYLVDSGRVYRKSDAWMRIVSDLSWPVSMLAVFRIVPRLVRDWCYDRVGNSRYRLFGRKDQCPVPDPDLMYKFIR